MWHAHRGGRGSQDGRWRKVVCRKLSIHALCCGLTDTGECVCKRERKIDPKRRELVQRCVVRNDAMTDRDDRSDLRLFLTEVVQINWWENTFIYSKIARNVIFAARRGIISSCFSGFFNQIFQMVCLKLRHQLVSKCWNIKISEIFSKVAEIRKRRVDNLRNRMFSMFTKMSFVLFK